MIVERLERPLSNVVDLNALAAHCRVDSEDGFFLPELQRFADAAVREAEDLAQIALLSQAVRVTLEGWPRARSFRLPVGPLQDWDSVTVSADGQPVEDFSAVTGTRPELRLTGQRPQGRIVIEYIAGYGDTPDTIKRRMAPRIETRAAQPGYTAALMAAREAWLSTASGLAELTAAVQGSVSLWEAGLSLADVRGTDLLNRRSMALTARALALRGECLFLIRDDRLIPATDWDLSTRYGQPRAYRVGLPEIGGGRHETALAGEVLHFRIGCDAVTPWAGSAPLSRARLSAGLLDEIMTALRDVFRDAPLGSQIVPVPEGSADDMEALRAAFKGRTVPSLKC